MNMLHAGLAAFALVIASFAAADPIFKCAGADGRMHYQATKCEAGQQGDQLVFKKTFDAPVANDPNASVIVYNDSRNSYFTMGSIEGYTVNMLVDTGAFMVTLPAAFAQKIGVRCGTAVIAGTGNGAVQGCTSTVRSIKIGSIALSNVEVLILPNANAVLLGQSALKRLRVEQSNDQIRLSVIGGVTK
jgi:aspartyl protease family protein